ncbi:MAG TPA: hypothetical protein VF937_17995 [Chloroflexota bacterium]
MNKGRQRAVPGLVAFLAALAALAAGSGCEARSSVEAAQTAIVAAQTVVPGAQATALAGATLVSGALADSQAILAMLQPLLAGASVELTKEPSDAANDAVTDVSIAATDSLGSFAQIDPASRQAAARAALALAGAYYPNATISLSVVDGSGASLVSGTRAAGEAPLLQ